MAAVPPVAAPMAAPVTAAGLMADDPVAAVLKAVAPVAAFVVQIKKYISKIYGDTRPCFFFNRL